jgi:cellulose biosynthesis protein BcsQ
MSRSGQVICMASVKGGSGKTVLAATFAAILSKIGKRVLLVDTDAATNGLSLLYLNEVIAYRESLPKGFPPPAGTYELPSRQDVTAEMVPLDQNLALLPATYKFFDSETVDVGRYKHSLRTATRQWREDFDFIFLDAQAGSDGFAHGAMERETSDHVILVSEYDPLSAAGIERLKAIFPYDLSYDRIWILLNKMLPDIATKYGEFLEVARYLPPITWNADVVRAYSRRSLAIDLDYGNDFTVAVCRSLSSWVDPKTDKELEAWLSDKAAELRLPLMTQVEDLKSEIDSVGSLAERATRRQNMVVALLVIILVSISTAAVALTISSPTRGSGAAFLGAALAGLGASGAALLTSLRPRVDRRVDREAELRRRLESLETLAELTDRDLVAQGQTLHSSR